MWFVLLAVLIKRVSGEGEVTFKRKLPLISMTQISVGPVNGGIRRGWVLNFSSGQMNRTGNDKIERK